jgi:hypothetical protein
MAEYTYLTETGVIIPDTADTLATIEGEYRVALGEELNTDPATPQGRIIAVETTARDTFLRNNADLANQINPRLAGGTFLDAIWALTGGQRRGQERTLVEGVVLGGVAETIIPGTVQIFIDGAPFEILAAVTLGAGGTATADFRSVNFGAIAAPAHAATFDPQYQVLGWETVDNPTAGILGRSRESDVASRLRRRRTLALQGVALPEAIISRLYDTEGVVSLAFRENTTDATAVIDGINMISHSIYVCVDGGSNLDVATAILAAKSGGCGYNGATVVNVTDPASGQIYPVRFQRPTEVNIQVEVTASPGSSTVDMATAIRTAIMNYTAGEIDGEDGFAVGVNVSPFEFSGAINIEAPGVFVRKVRIGLVAGALSTDELPITLMQVPRLNVNNIAVIPV